MSVGVMRAPLPRARPAPGGFDFAGRSAARSRESRPMGEVQPPGDPAKGRPKLPSVGDQLLDYQVVRFIAGGGMARLYEAIDVRLDRPVALKAMLPLPDPDLERRFVREGRLLAKLQHPNLVAVHASGKARGLQFLVLEYVHGATPWELVSGTGPIPPVIAVEAVLQASRGLLAARGARAEAGRPSRRLAGSGGGLHADDLEVSGAEAARHGGGRAGPRERDDDPLRAVVPVRAGHARAEVRLGAPASAASIDPPRPLRTRRRRAHPPEPRPRRIQDPGGGSPIQCRATPGP